MSQAQTNQVPSLSFQISLYTKFSKKFVELQASTRDNLFPLTIYNQSSKVSN